MKIRRIVYSLLGCLMLIGACSKYALANSNDSQFTVNISSSSFTASTSNSVRIKDGTTSSYINYPSSSSGPVYWVAAIYGSASASSGFTNCTSVIFGTNTHRPIAKITKGTAGYVEQDVYEKYGIYYGYSPVYAKIYGKKYNSGTGTVNGIWSPDSVYEPGLPTYNN